MNNNHSLSNRLVKYDNTIKSDLGIIIHPPDLLDNLNQFSKNIC